MISSKKRIQWLDFAKGLVIFLVVMCHSGFQRGMDFKVLEYVLLTIIMPLFFAISGFLYKPTSNFRKYKILLYKKIISLGVPYIIFTFGDVILRMTKNHNPMTNFYRIYYIPIGYLWFLYALFFIFVIIGLMDLFHIKLWIQLIISILLMFIQMYLPWQESSKGNMNPLAGIGGYMICFYIGYIIRKFSFEHLLRRKFISIVLLVLWMCLLIVQMLLTGLQINNDVFMISNWCTKLLCIPVFFGIFVNFPHDNSLFKYFDKYGKLTLIIYLVHIIMMKFSHKIVVILATNNPFFIFIIYLISSWYLSILVCYLARHIKWINFIFYPRKYISKILFKTRWGKKLL